MLFHTVFYFVVLEYSISCYTMLYYVILYVMLCYNHRHHTHTYIYISKHQVVTPKKLRKAMYHYFSLILLFSLLYTSQNITVQDTKPFTQHG